jgi:thymidylate synthase
MSRADELFIQNCADILKNGASDATGCVRARWSDGAPATTLRRFGVVNRYDLSREFPILTLRRVPLAKAMDELLWIWQKKSNNIRDLNSHIWDSWADETGSIGKAYGYQLGIKHAYPEGEFDQVDRLLYDISHNPNSRRMITNMYNHSDLNEMNLYPCAYGVTVTITDGRLNLLLNQRSQDMLVANGWNTAQYAALAHMLARVSGYAVGEFLHVIADAHIYDRHIPLVEELIAREPYPAPKFSLAEGVTDFYAFMPEHFKLEGYRAHPFRHEIAVAI